MLCTRLRFSKAPKLAARLISDEELYSKLSKDSSQTQGNAPKRKQNVLNTLGPCVDLIKQHDYEHYLCVCLAPVGTRRGLSALRAFNVELSKSAVTPYSTTQEKEINRLKLLWWRGVVEGKVEGKVEPAAAPSSPVAYELSSAIRRHSLSKGFLLKLIDARVDPNTYNSLHEVEHAADATFSTVNYLSMEVLGYKSVDVDHAASHLGRCEGHIALIRSIPLLASRGACLVPSTTLAKTGISQQDIMRGKNKDKIRDVVHEIASSAHLHAEQCEKLMLKLPPSSKIGCLPLTPARLFLKRLQKYDFDIFNDRTLMRNPFLSFILVKDSMRMNWGSNKSAINKFVNTNARRGK